MLNVDIAIIGGGMAGLVVAAGLKDSSLRIAVIEGYQPESKIEPEFDTRVSALSHSSQRILENVGAWQGIVDRRSSAYQGMEVWEQDSFAKINFDAEAVNHRNLGHIVENRIVQLALLDVVKKQSNVTLLMPTKCQTIAFGENEAWLTLDNGSALTAKLVIGADGANSWLRNQCDIPVTERDYGHSAIVATIETSEPHDGIARQIFRPDGPLAFLPLSHSNQSSIVWSTSPLQAEMLVDLEDHEFNKYLTAAFDHRLGLCHVVSQREVFPLKMRYAQDFVKSRVALVGDAAHTIHPLAGQGANLGLLDAASLVQEIEKIWQAGEDIGSQEQLRFYERWRKSEAADMIVAMESFKTLFSGDNPVAKLIRGVGLTVTDKAVPVKYGLLRRALGEKGELPILAKK
ncbi:FAD-dependent 2-octaprenylphenol hydroxylase [Vibrio sp. SS-MA-C1-2]|uniref:FAD-dependent 2-octaprenylphenol hydroxylase n=1 Tax=Vibrio sp. SS-MA-C1-2 TaxID=2908646 RepID=UPI001F1D8F54|nr:FAD-dependent 2-octaprenylphenol hydroxylase [Vibrio sp. SS-MA-C1-2]UJF19042.1 FAD-dependent 2-octaprenylphenol hydroxylase [Vibrio sp. SS-MA-C1-2]